MTTHANLTFNDALGIIYTATDGSIVQYNGADFAWTLTGSALVLFMSYGVGFFYSGLLRRPNALSAQLVITAIMAVVTVEWVVVGYSLTFSQGNGFIGSFEFIGLRNVTGQRGNGLEHTPRLLQALYQLSFAVITPAISFGAMAERGSIGGVCPRSGPCGCTDWAGGCLILATLWSIIVCLARSFCPSHIPFRSTTLSLTPVRSSANLCPKPYFLQFGAPVASSTRWETWTMRGADPYISK